SPLLSARKHKHPPANTLQEGQMQRRVLRTRAAADYVGLTPSTLEKKRLSGDGPPFVRLGARAVGYTVDDLDAFVEAGRRTSTSDSGEGPHEDNQSRHQNTLVSAPRTRSEPRKRP